LLGHTGFFLPLFFIQLDPVPARVSRVSGQPAGPGFKTMELSINYKILFYKKEF
jgi:hypothetical protein